MAGAGVQWLRDEMELVKDAAQTEAFANAVEDTNGVYVVPAFTALVPHIGIHTQEERLQG